jgi:hypothetical protein
MMFLRDVLHGVMSENVDLLLVESVYCCIRDVWHYNLSSLNDPHPLLRANTINLMTGCRIYSSYVRFFRCVLPESCDRLCLRACVYAERTTSRTLTHRKRGSLGASRAVGHAGHTPVVAEHDDRCNGTPSCLCHCCSPGAELFKRVRKAPSVSRYSSVGTGRPRGRRLKC